MSYANYNKCKICGQFGWEWRHVCPPAWRVSVDGGPELSVHALDAGEAAEKASEICDDTGSHTGGRQVEVTVWGEGGKVSYFVVEGQMIPDYSAREVSAAEALV